MARAQVLSGEKMMGHQRGFVQGEGPFARSHDAFLSARASSIHSIFPSSTSSSSMVFRNNNKRC